MNESNSLKPAETQALNIPVVMPSTSFSLTWKDAQKEPPKEGGRYWCIVREINDLGTSYFQWNCAYNPNDIPRWTSNALRHDVILWTELAPMPF